MLADEDFHYLIITVKKQNKRYISFPIHGLVPALKVVLISWKPINQEFILLSIGCHCLIHFLKKRKIWTQCYINKIQFLKQSMFYYYSLYHKCGGYKGKKKFKGNNVLASSRQELWVCILLPFYTHTHTTFFL